LAEQAMQVVDRLNAMDGALRAIGGVADRMRSLLVNRLDGATGGSVALAEEARGALEEIASQLNTRVDDRYLFAGSRTDMEPVSLPTSLSTVADPDLYYRGDGVELSVRVGNSRELPYGITAAEPGFARLIAGLGEAASADLAGDRNGLETALVGLTSAIGSIAELRGQVGSRAQQLLTIADEHKATASLLDDTVARLEKTDIPTAMADLATHEATLQASYLTVSRLAGLSLADYLR
jgi:flagellar hook-associated protein 3 FlgL